MNIKDIGYKSHFDDFLLEKGLDKSQVGRISACFKNRYTVKTASFEMDALMTGNYQYSVKDQSEIPVVGDWVSLEIFDQDPALITHLLPRINSLERRSAGNNTGRQIIAANIDCGLIVESISDNFKINRVERYITICNSSNIKPLLLITKIDLIDTGELKEIVSSVTRRIEPTEVYTISNISKLGFEALNSLLKRGETYCLLGLSGVGKSTLINNLLGAPVLKTNTISNSTKKGVHTTTHRELFLLENGSIIIDNPGMREIGLTDSSRGLDSTFEKITVLSKDCRFKDCTHTHEKQCSVLNALAEGYLDQEYYKNYLKLRKEQFHYSSSLLEKRRKDKTFGKMVKNIKKTKSLEKL